jgi:Tfp pilus assembly protein PilN
MLIHVLAIWGCMPEITNGCMDMTNASSTYLSIAVGAVVGALISWLVFSLQKKSTIKQEENLQRLNELNESHDRMLKLIQQFQKHQEHILDQILSMDKKIDSAIEKRKDVK